MSDRWLTLQELADDLRVTERSIRRWIAAGEKQIDVLRIGGVTRVRLVRDCLHTSIDSALSEAHALAYGADISPTTHDRGGRSAIRSDAG